MVPLQLARFPAARCVHGSVRGKTLKRKAQKMAECTARAAELLFHMLTTAAFIPVFEDLLPPDLPRESLRDYLCSPLLAAAALAV